MRQVVLDTETTGLEPEQGHRIIEIGAVELLDRKRTGREFHCYLNPERDVDEGALAVHGISNAFLADKPTFARIVDDLLSFIGDGELIIHNASFDLGFLQRELTRCDAPVQDLRKTCSIIDTLLLAREMHPGQRNSLDALCKRHGVDNSRRDYHGALLDAQILADVYLAMTGGQVTMLLDTQSAIDAEYAAGRTGVAQWPPGKISVIRASEEELTSHEARLSDLDKRVGGACLWRKLPVAPQGHGVTFAQS